MTRTECEDKIVKKLDEIAEIAREFSPRAYYLCMFVFGGSAAVWCTDEETGEFIIDRHRAGVTDDE